jgi:hypothetical protein
MVDIARHKSRFKGLDLESLTHDMAAFYSFCLQQEKSNKVIIIIIIIYVFNFFFTFIIIIIAFSCSGATSWTIGFPCGALLRLLQAC